MLPVSTLTSATATGDVVTGPGAPKYLVKCLPVSCIGDAVTGSVCVGAVTTTTSKVIVLCRPVTTLTAVVSGVNPMSGIPVASAVAVTVGVNNIY